MTYKRSFYSITIATNDLPHIECAADLDCEESSKTHICDVPSTDNWESDCLCNGQPSTHLINPLKQIVFSSHSHFLVDTIDSFPVQYSGMCEIHPAPFVPSSMERCSHLHRCFSPNSDLRKNFIFILVQLNTSKQRFLQVDEAVFLLMHSLWWNWTLLLMKKCVSVCMLGLDGSLKNSVALQIHESVF